MKYFLHSLFFFLLVTHICFAQWTQVGLNGESIRDIAVQNSNIFAVTSDSGKVFRSVDIGASWSVVLDSTARDVAVSASGKVFLIKDIFINSPWWETSIYSSLDNGDTWTWLNVMEQLADSFEIGSVQNITASLTGKVFCGIRKAIWPQGFWTHIGASIDDGLTWTTPGASVKGGTLFDYKAHSIITIGVCEPECPGPPGGVNYLSTDNGNTWTELIGEYIGGYYRVLGFFSNDNILVGGEFIYPLGEYFPGLLISTDMCSTWTQISSLNTKAGISWSNGSLEGMIIGSDIGVFIFSDEGDSLGSRNEGLTNLNIQTLILDNNGYVYAGTENGVWRRPLTEIITSVENQITQPTEFILEQNYPNPFNSSSVIRYSIPKSSQVVIKVVDVLGNEIETLVNEQKQTGNYEITWYADGLTSGVYLYQLRSGDFVETKKMLLLK